MGLGDKMNQWFYPELKRFPPGPARQRAMQESICSSRSDWRNYAVILGAAAIVCVLGITGERMSQWLFRCGVAEPVAALTPLVLGPVVFVVHLALLLRFCRQRSGPALRRLPTELGQPLCTHCGDLAGNTSGVCPECGTPEGLRTVDPPPDQPAA